MRIETTQLAGCAERIDSSVVPGWSGARTVAGRVGEFSVPFLRPEFAARVDVVSRYHFLAATLLDRVSLSIRDDERGMSDADRLFPEHGQAALGPVSGNGCFVILAIALWTTEVCPVVTRCG